MFDTIHSMGDLQELYPNPGREMVVGDTPLIHHCYAFGRMYVCIAACKEGLDAARKIKDTGAIAHLSRHIQEYTEWQQLQKGWQEIVDPKRAAIVKR